LVFIYLVTATSQVILVLAEPAQKATWSSLLNPAVGLLFRGLTIKRDKLVYSVNLFIYEDYMNCWTKLHF